MLILALGVLFVRTGDVERIVSAAEEEVDVGSEDVEPDTTDADVKVEGSNTMSHLVRPTLQPAAIIRAVMSIEIIALFGWKG